MGAFCREDLKRILNFIFAASTQPEWNWDAFLLIGKRPHGASMVEGLLHSKLRGPSQSQDGWCMVCHGACEMTDCKRASVKGGDSAGFEGDGGYV